MVLSVLFEKFAKTIVNLKVKYLKMTKIANKNSGNGIGIGAALGVAFGAAYGVSSKNYSMSIALGLSIGIAVGAIFDIQKNRKEKTTKV